jgi:hypothetical protein
LPPRIESGTLAQARAIRLRRIMNRDQALLRHFLAAIAYRTAKALRDAPAGFEAFHAGHDARTPRDLVRHMSGVLNYAIGILSEPRGVLKDCPTYLAEVERFFALLRETSDRMLEAVGISDAVAERLLQGPLSDVMSHAGQLALLRRLSGSPIAPENFYDAAIHPSRLGPDQAAPSSPDRDWPEAPDDWIPPGGERSRN